MSWTKKAVSLGTIGMLLLAGSVIMSGCQAMAAQAATQSSKSTAKLAAPVEAPLNEEELIKLIKHNRKDIQKVANEVRSRGLDFEFTPEIEKQITKAGGRQLRANIGKLIAYFKQFTPSARAARKASGGVKVSTAEATAYNKLKSERDPDSIIKQAESYAQSYPKSPLLTYVYAMEAGAYQQKNDAANVVKYGEKSLQLDPKNLISLLMVSEVLPQPQMLNVNDTEKEKRLAEAAQYAHQALKEINQLPKRPKETDAAYQKRKGDIEAGAYASLGMVHLERAGMALEGVDMGELAKAEQNYKLAIQKASTPNPADYYRLGEVYSSEKKYSDAIGAFSKAGQLAQGTIIQKLADQQIQALKKEQKSQAKAGK